MKPRKVTQEMTERAVEKYHGTRPGEIYSNVVMETMRGALDAALNPPPEPEIVVTPEMAGAGVAVIAPYESLKAPVSSLVLAYRAMRALEPKPVWSGMMSIKTVGGSIKSSPKVVAEKRLCVERRKKLLMCFDTPTDPMGRRSGKDRRKL